METSRADLWKVALAVVVALVLRIAYVGWGLPSETHDLNSYHPDENGVLIALSNMNPSKGDFDTKTYYWGTAYFYMCGALFKALQLVGVLQLVSNKTYYLDHLDQLDRMYLAGRILSLTLAVMSVPLIYYVGKRLFNPRTGIFAAALLAVLPIHVMRSPLMLPDGTGVFFLLLSLCCFVDAKNRKWFAIAGLFFGLACASKYHFFLTILFFACVWVRDRKWPDAIAFASGAVVGFIVGCPYLFPNLPVLLGFIGKVAHGVSAGHGAILGEYRSQLLCALNMFLFAGGAFFLIASAISVDTIARWQKDRFCLLLPFVLFTGLMGFSQTRLSYYMLPGVTFGVLLVAEWCQQNAKRGSIVIGGVVALSFLQSWSFAEPAWRTDTRTQMSNYLKEHIPAGTRIGVTHNKYFYTPPILMEKESYFQVEIFGDNFRDYNLDKLKRQKPPYFVLSEFEWHEPSVHPERAPERKAFIDAIMNSGEYALEKEGRASPSILGLELPRITPPWNERVLYPTMRLYRANTMHRQNADAP